MLPISTFQVRRLRPPRRARIRHRRIGIRFLPLHTGTSRFSYRRASSRSQRATLQVLERQDLHAPDHAAREHTQATGRTTRYTPTYTGDRRHRDAMRTQKTEPHTACMSFRQTSKRSPTALRLPPMRRSRQAGHTALTIPLEDDSRQSRPLPCTTTCGCTRAPPTLPRAFRDAANCYGTLPSYCPRSLSPPREESCRCSRALLTCHGCSSADSPQRGTPYQCLASPLGRTTRCRPATRPY